ncbi:MAG TPA: hypothetical protein VF980_15090 [Thermoanaerobaculia bacterium]
MREGGSDRAAVVAIIVIWLASLLLWIQPGLTIPDAAGYVVYLPSTWIDHDLLFFNEWQRLGLIRDGLPMFRSATATGHLSDHWAIGPALLWYPAFVAADAERAVVPSLRSFARDGIVLPYNIAVVVTSAIAGLATLLIGYGVARRWYGVGASLAAAFATWFGTTLLWYSLRDSAMSHAPSALACAIVVATALRLRRNMSAEAVFAAGLAIGFAAMVRIQNAAFVIVPFIVIDAIARRELLKRIHLFIAGGVLGVLPELIVSAFIYGTPLGFASIGVRAIGWYPWTRFWGVEMLFSWYHGLFTWTPLAAIAIAGLVALWRDDRPLAIAALASIAIQWIANSSADRAFWAAISFGARRFDNCTIFFLLGIAAALARWRWRAGVPVIAACTWTMLLFFVGRHVDLNAYQTFDELWRAIPSGLADRPLALLQFVRAPMRLTTLFLIVGAIAAHALICAAVWLVPARLRSALAGLYLAVMTAYLAWTGSHDAGRVAGYQGVIDRSRRFEELSGGHDFGEQSLFENELQYLRKTGRNEEAQRTERELHELLGRRAFALQRMREAGP